MAHSKEQNEPPETNTEKTHFDSDLSVFKTTILNMHNALKN